MRNIGLDSGHSSDIILVEKINRFIKILESRKKSRKKLEIINLGILLSNSAKEKREHEDDISEKIKFYNSLMDNTFYLTENNESSEIFDEIIDYHMCGKSSIL